MAHAWGKNNFFAGMSELPTVHIKARTHEKFVSANHVLPRSFNIEFKATTLA